MINELEPLEENWYYDLEQDHHFMVVSVDEDEGLIEIQHENGEIEEIDMEEWEELDLEASEEPEDWKTPLDEEEEEEEEGGGNYEE
ncbi:MAG: hypothetical protein P8130_13990 [Deltaproteobacteria bacterium]